MPNELTNALKSVIQSAAKSLPTHTGKTAAYRQRYQGATDRVLIVADTSASMAEPAGPSRRKLDVLAEAISDLPYAVIEFNSSVHRRATGQAVVLEPRGGTALHLALDEAAKDRPAKTIVISDGEPDSEESALRAAESLTGVIDVIYCGPDGGPGLAFLGRLARSTGGQTVRCDLRRSPGLLLPTIRRLALPAPGDM